ncbi:hypothetical protein SO802_005101 [Lithocarpus litseifolius]|uniref:RNase H type-1 domain-containing protein n=1 Tax=Lithocarpus litseifolius TaxID=425828 RepID=A0AAW2DH76_9ROSI
MLSVKQEARMWILKNIFGREFGGYRFLTRLNSSFGELVQEDYRKEVFAISAWFLWNRRNAIHLGRPVHLRLISSHWRRVIFEGDSAMVINALNQGSAGLSTYGVVIEDIPCQAMVFQFSVFNHASRSCNCVADASAKKAEGSRGTQMWLNDPPKDIASLLLFDVY